LLVQFVILGLPLTNNLKESKFSSRRYSKQIEIRECLLSFGGAESFVFRFSIQNFKDQDIYGTVILPVVLYGCETWSLTLREKRRLRVFENRMLRGIFGLKRDEVTGGVKKTT